MMPELRVIGGCMLALAAGMAAVNAIAAYDSRLMTGAGAFAAVAILALGSVQ